MKARDQRYTHKTRLTPEVIADALVGIRESINGTKDLDALKKRADQSSIVDIHREVAHLRGIVKRNQEQLSELVGVIEWLVTGKGIDTTDITAALNLIHDIRRERRLLESGAYKELVKIYADKCWAAK